MDKKEAAKKLLDLSSEMSDENKSKELINIASFITDMDNSNEKKEIIYNKDVLFDIKKICYLYKIYFDENYLQQSIDNFIYAASWSRISSDIRLSENFIREFQDKVNWNNISANQKLSEEFKLEFQNKISH